MTSDIPVNGLAPDASNVDVPADADTPLDAPDFEHVEPEGLELQPVVASAKTSLDEQTSLRRILWDPMETDSKSWDSLPGKLSCVFQEGRTFLSFALCLSGDGSVAFGCCVRW